MAAKLTLLAALMGVATGVPLPTFNSEDRVGMTYAHVSPTDTLQDMVRKFTPMLVRTSGMQGGSEVDQLGRVVTSMIPIARALINFKGQSDNSYDVAARQRDADLIAEMSALVMSTVQGIAKIVEENPGDSTTFQDMSAVTGEIAGIGKLALNVAKKDERAKSGDFDVDAVDRALSSILGFMTSMDLPTQ